MPRLKVEFFIDTEGLVSSQEIAEAVGAVFERIDFPYKKPEFVQVARLIRDPGMPSGYREGDKLNTDFALVWKKEEEVEAYAATAL